MDYGIINHMLSTAHKRKDLVVTADENTEMKGVDEAKNESDRLSVDPPRKKAKFNSAPLTHQDVEMDVPAAIPPRKKMEHGTRNELGPLPVRKIAVTSLIQATHDNNVTALDPLSMKWSKHNKDHKLVVNREEMMMLIRSTYRNQFTKFEFVGKEANRSWRNPVGDLSPRDLELLQIQMPQLKSLTASIAYHIHEIIPTLNLPFTLLTELDLTISIASEDSFDDLPLSHTWKRVGHAINSISLISTLTNLSIKVAPIYYGHVFPGLERRLDGGPGPTIPVSVLKPLSSLKSSLTSLKLELPHECVCDRYGLQREHVRFIRQFHHLTHLDIVVALCTPSAEMLNWLTEEPFTLPLQFINLKYSTINDQCSTPLGRLVNLTHLDIQALTMRDPTCISKLVNLRSFQAVCHPGVEAALLVAALSHCTSMTVLGLSHPDMTTIQLSQLLQPMTQLKSLAINSMGNVDDLSFLSHAHLKLSLETLLLCSFPQLPLTALHHVHHLHALTKLAIFRSFINQPECDEIGIFDPKSPTFQRDLWPNMKSFSWR